MSFLGDLVNSIGTDKAPPPPPRQIQRPVVATAVAPSKPLPKPQQSTSPVLPPATSLKRKVDERDDKALQRTSKPITMIAQTNNVKPRSPIPAMSVSKPPLAKPAVAATPPAPTAPTKAPPKGSFADIMARAKLAQEQRPGSQVGLIKHQATAKEKISKVAERRRQEQEKEKLKSEKGKPVTKPPVTANSDRNGKRRSASPQKKGEPAKVPRVPRPPLHAPQTGYKGTMGQASKRGKEVAAGRAPKRSRYDEYLGTDEEEDDEMEDYGDDDGYGYGSDASSDMEAGMDDIEFEEASALRAARQDDARELALENQLKREKEDRRRKLAAIANKRGR